MHMVVGQWIDNTIATVAMCHGIYPADKVKRWCKKLGECIKIQWPCMIWEYNIFMGGTDRMDENIAIAESLSERKNGTGKFKRGLLILW